MSDFSVSCRESNRNHKEPQSGVDEALGGCGGVVGRGPDFVAAGHHGSHSGARDQTARARLECSEEMLACTGLYWVHSTGHSTMQNVHLGEIQQKLVAVGSRRCLLEVPWVQLQRETINVFVKKKERDIRLHLLSYSYLNIHIRLLYFHRINNYTKAPRKKR